LLFWSFYLRTGKLVRLVGVVIAAATSPTSLFAHHLCLWICLFLFQPPGFIHFKKRGHLTDNRRAPAHRRGANFIGGGETHRKPCATHSPARATHVFLFLLNCFSSRDEVRRKKRNRRNSFCGSPVRPRNPSVRFVMDDASRGLAGHTEHGVTMDRMSCNNTFIGTAGAPSSTPTRDARSSAERKRQRPHCCQS
jgi:hypothetical protein